jgi:hypothetical protein
MFDDVGKTIKAILYDRITSPLFGTFLFSWCGWNWRLIVLFLTDSTTTVAKKFQYLDSELYPSNAITFIYGLLLPATTTAFFIYIYPWFAKKVYGYWREQQNELKKLQVEKDGEKPLTKDEAYEITSQALLSELRYQEEREKREARIRDLENLVKSLQTENEPPHIDKAAKRKEASAKLMQHNKPKVGNVVSVEVMNGMLSVLRLIGRLAPIDAIDKQSFLTNVSHDSELSKLEVNLVLHCLDNLVSEEYVSESKTGWLSVLPKGRTALLQKKLVI